MYIHIYTHSPPLHASSLSLMCVCVAFLIQCNILRPSGTVIIVCKRVLFVYLYFQMYGGHDFEGNWGADPTGHGRFFSYWTDQQLEAAVSPLFQVLLFANVVSDRGGDPSLSLHFQSLHLQKLWPEFVPLDLCRCGKISTRSKERKKQTSYGIYSSNPRFSSPYRPLDVSVVAFDLCRLPGKAHAPRTLQHVAQRCNTLQHLVLVPGISRKTWRSTNYLKRSELGVNFETCPWSPADHLPFPVFGTLQCQKVDGQVDGRVIMQLLLILESSWITTRSSICLWIWSARERKKKWSASDGLTACPFNFVHLTRARPRSWGGYLYLYACLYIYVYVYVHAYMYAWMYMWMYMCM